MHHFVAGLATVAVAFGAGAALAEGDKFTAADVLGWDAKSQNWYFEVAASMGAAIASQNSSAQARCINNWYFESGAQRATANVYIKETMARFPDYHPALIMISVLEKKCGSLTFK